jgi:elongation factor P--beta-lysine ligase
MNPILLRQSIIKKTRAFFDSHQCEEMTLPLMHTVVPAEPYIYPFETPWSTIHEEKTLYLSTSPEAGLKKMIALGYQNVYEISHAFRNLENSGPTHTPEFLMLEWYRGHATYREIMTEVEQYIQSILGTGVMTYQGNDIDLSSPWKRISIKTLFATYLDIDLSDYLTLDAIAALAQSLGYEIADATWEQLFFQLFLNRIEPHIGYNPMFLTDYPSSISPLAKPSTNDPQFAERFELYIGGMEIGNGNTENMDTASIRKVFAEEIRSRTSKTKQVMQIDEEFLTSLLGMQPSPYAGVGIGLDRLTMIAGNLPDIRVLSSTI